MNQIHNVKPSQGKRVTWANKPPIKKETYPVDLIEKKALDKQSEEHSYSFMVEEKNALKNPLFTATLKDRKGKLIRVGFDTFSSVTLIKPGMCDDEDVVTGTPLPLSGIGGERMTSGKRGKIHLILEDKLFNITGCITETPKGVDVLLGTPQLINMGAIIDLRQKTVLFKNFFMKTLDLKPIERKNARQEAWEIEINLPEMEIQISHKSVLGVPYQCPRGHSIPKSIQSKADEVIRAEIEKGHLEKVEYSDDLWISPVFFKQKSSGDLRLLVDLSVLNNYVVTPDYWSCMGANRTMFLSTVPRDCYFTKIDISDAFHSCPVEEKSRKFLAIRYGTELLRYRTAPQGLSTSALFWPLHLASGLNQILGEDWKNYAKIYVDDILVMGRNEEDCMEKTSAIVSALTKMGKDISPKSVTVPSQEIECIGIRFSGQGYRIADEGVKKLSVALSKNPKTMKDMRGLIGSIQYAKSVFHHGGRPSAIADQLSQLLKFVSGKKFKYDPEIKDIQKGLLEKIKPQYMEFPNEKEITRMIITTDASDSGVGAILYQSSSTDANIETEISEGRIIDIMCKPLSSAEQKWHTFEKEGYAIKAALVKWRPLLIASGKPIVVYTDSTTAMGKFQKSKIIESNKAKGKRWLGWIDECSFIHSLPLEFRVIKGEVNHLADLLSRIDNEQEEIWTINTDVVRQNEKILIPDEEVKPLVKSIHDRGHYGIRETAYHFKEHFVGKNLTKIVEQVCKECSCYLAKAEKKNQQSIATISGDGIPWEGICVDTVGPIKPECDGYNYIFTAICRSTKFIVLKPIKDIGVRTIIRAMTDIFEERGYPRNITLDNFPTFRSHQFKNLLESRGIEIRYTPVHSPERNGLIERQHKVIGQLLRFYFDQNGDWVQHLPEIQCRINDKTLGHADGTRITPFNLVHRFSYQHPRMPQAKISWSYDELMNKIKQIDIYEQAQRRHRSYEVNQQVLRYCPENNPNKSAKLNFRFKRSIITAVLGKNTYSCRDEDGATAVVDGRSLRKMAN
jgi:hypothetical protein